MDRARAGLTVPIGLGAAVLLGLGGGCTPDTETGKDSPAPVEDRGPWISVSAGERVSCGVHEDHSVECWGDNEPQPGENRSGVDTGWFNYGEDEPPEIDAVSVWLGAGTSDDNDSNQACAVAVDGDVVCWALGGSPPMKVKPPLAMGVYWTCGLTDDGSVACWNDFLDTSATWIASQTSAAYVTADYQVLCVGMDEGGATCGYPYDPDPFAVAPAPDATLVVATEYAGLGFCALGADGSIACISGTSGEVMSDYAVPNDLGPFTDLCASGGWGCALDTDGHPHCFGVHDYTGDFSIPDPDIALTSLSCGNAHACGLTPDGDVACWGNDDYSQASPPGEHVATGL